jgi:hypothetical protein
VFGWPDPNTGFDQSEHALYTCYFIMSLPWEPIGRIISPVQLESVDRSHLVIFFCQYFQLWKSLPKLYWETSDKRRFSANNCRQLSSTVVNCRIFELVNIDALHKFGALYTLPYRKYLMARVLTVFPFFYWCVLMAYVFSDYSGTVKCKISKFVLPNHARKEFDNFKKSFQDKASIPRSQHTTDF